MELACPCRVDAVPRAVIAEARSIGNQPFGLEAVAEEDRLAAVPGVAEVPHLVAADDDRVVPAGGFRLVKRESRGTGQLSNRVDELACFLVVVAKLASGGSLRKLGLKRAFGLGAPDATAIMVEQLGVVTSRAQRLYQAARLPV